MAGDVLRDDSLSAPTQIADLNLICWALVQAAYELQAAVNRELGDLEEGS